jgi:hypothetical protein
LAGRELDDGDFDELFEHLRKLLVRMNRFVGRRADLSSEEQTDLLNKITDSATALGCAVKPGQMADYQEQHTALDNIAALQALAALVSLSGGTATAPNTDAALLAQMQAGQSAPSPTDAALLGQMQAGVQAAVSPSKDEAPLAEQAARDAGLLAQMQAGRKKKSTRATSHPGSTSAEPDQSIHLSDGEV